VAATVQPQFATKDLALQLVAKSLQAQGEAAIPLLKVREGQNVGTEMILEKKDYRYVLGRSIAADLVLFDTDASRRHVEVWRQGARVMLRDLGSKNGSKLDSTYLLPDKEIAWPDAAVLGIGAQRIALHDPAQDALVEMSRAADAHLSDSEQGRLAAAGQVQQTGPAVPNTRDGTRADAPLQKKQRSPATKKPAQPGRVTSADWSVVILALAVLGASLLGILWMLGGK
jgi:hypothetical protein